MTDVEKTVATLIQNWGGRLVARRSGEVVIKIGGCLMLVSDKNGLSEAVTGSEYPRLRCCHGGECPHSEAVFNIGLEVGDVEAAVSRMRRRGTRVIVQPTSVISDLGEITWAVVSSPCDNILHSLVNTSKYRGRFLHGFEDVSDNKSEVTVTGLTFIDHVTYVCRRGESESILAWYRDTCGMTRFSLSGETEEAGLEVAGDAALRLKVGEWVSEWMCRETGVRANTGNKERDFKLVLAEPLSDESVGHVNK